MPDSNAAPTPNETVTVEIDEGHFPLRSVLRAAHRLTGTCYAEVHPVDSKIFVRLRYQNANSTADLRGVFLNLLLDEELRAQIASETEAERRLILAHALSRRPVFVPSGNPDVSNS